MTKLESVPTPVPKRSGGRSNQRESSEPFVGVIPELNGVIFDVVSSKKAGHYEASKKRVAQYLVKELRRGGDIEHTVTNMFMFVIPRPKNPKNPVRIATETDGVTPNISNEEEEDYEFDVGIYEKRKGSYLIRLEMHEENIHRVFSIILDQCTEAMLGQLESMPGWNAIKASMDLIAFLVLLRQVTYSYKGEKLLSRSHRREKATGQHQAM